jgi:hypothetical protein
MLSAQRRNSSSPLIIRVEDDPVDRTRVVVTDENNNRATMTAYSAMTTCRFATNVELALTWTGWSE